MPGPKITTVITTKDKGGLALQNIHAYGESSISIDFAPGGAVRARMPIVDYTGENMPADVVRFVATADCYLAFGGDVIVADATGWRIRAGEVYEMRRQAGGGHVSILGINAGTLIATEVR